MLTPVQDVVFTIVGKAAAMEAHLKGLRGVFTKLAEQHRASLALLQRAAFTDDLTERSRLWYEVRRELLSHEQAELREVYPLLDRYEATHGIAEHHFKHANELEDMIRSVHAVSVGDAAWRPALEQLIAMVKEHMDTEENETFPIAQKALGDALTKQLERSFLRAKVTAALELT